MKKTESFASIFGDDYEEITTPTEDGATLLKLEKLVQ